MRMYRKVLIYSPNKDFDIIFRKVASKKYDLLVFKDLSRTLKENNVSKIMVNLLLHNCVANGVDCIFIDSRLEELKNINTEVDNGEE